ncbi:uncharacterized protein LOC117101429 [Anneissia japonica]|uniref:uncharacterized protein LOC117101429 n=1 Tax=Anneissia japonica TaxID=1529436 RepID=UPI00142561AE|nr:uncharacterized protein LOC117101429 [Anneissia japonica]
MQKYQQLHTNDDPVIEEPRRYYTVGEMLSRMMFLTALAVCVVILLSPWPRPSRAAFFPYPFHASCRANWTFGLNCSEVNMRLVSQVKKWSNRSNCPENKGEKCLYAIVGQSATQLNTTHTTPAEGYVDDQFFNFYEQSSGICFTTGYSRSETFYAVLDKATNYCNLHNLITGSGLDKAPKYSESTHDGVCTQYSSADCERY